MRTTGLAMKLPTTRQTVQVLTLHEYQRHPVQFALDRDQRAALAEARIEVAAPEDEGYTWILRPSSMIGVLHLAGLSIVVRPKIPIDRVMFLVAYSLDPREWRKWFNLESAAGFLESIIPAFTHHTHQAIRCGLLQGYRHEEEALQTVRGRIRFNDQINRRSGFPLPIEVAYDEFTEDIEENRLLKTALHRLAHLPVRSEQARKDLNALRPSFNTVEIGDYPRGVPEIQYTRLNSHYRPAVELARLIIENSSLELFHGEVTGASFMLDMNAVFERFLFIALREALKLSEREWKSQDRLTLDVDGKIAVYPDLSWWGDGCCLFVGDAKYKRLAPSGFQHADIYQMLAYCTAADLPSGLLVYPKGGSDPGHYEIKHSGKTIEVNSLDLEGEPDDILSEIDRIAARVKEHAHEPAASRLNRAYGNLESSPSLQTLIQAEA